MIRKLVSVRHIPKKKRVAFEVDVPESIEEAVKYMGEARVLRLIQVKIETMARATARNLLSYDHSIEATKVRMEEEWFPFRRLRKVAPLELRRIDEDETADTKDSQDTGPYKD